MSKEMAIVPMTTSSAVAKAINEVVEKASSLGSVGMLLHAKRYLWNRDPVGQSNAKKAAIFLTAWQVAGSSNASSICASFRNSVRFTRTIPKVGNQLQVSCHELNDRCQCRLLSTNHRNSWEAAMIHPLCPRNDRTPVRRVLDSKAIDGRCEVPQGHLIHSTEGVIN